MNERTNEWMNEGIEKYHSNENKQAKTSQN